MTYEVTKETLLRIAQVDYANTDFPAWIKTNAELVRNISRLNHVIWNLHDSICWGMESHVRLRVYCGASTTILAQPCWPLVAVAASGIYPSGLKQQPYDQSFNDIAEVQQLLGWRLARWEESLAGTSNAGAPAQPAFSRSHLLLDHIAAVVNYWPSDFFYNNPNHLKTQAGITQDCRREWVYWDAELAIRAMTNSVLTGGPDDGGGGQTKLPPP
jgi:hypothetical protein